MSAGILGFICGCGIGGVLGMLTLSIFAHKRITEQEGIIDRLRYENTQKCTEITVLQNRLTLK